MKIDGFDRRKAEAFSFERFKKGSVVCDSKGYVPEDIKIWSTRDSDSDTPEFSLLFEDSCELFHYNHRGINTEWDRNLFMAPEVRDFIYIHEATSLEFVSCFEKTHFDPKLFTQMGLDKFFDGKGDLHNRYISFERSIHSQM